MEKTGTNFYDTILILLTDIISVVLGVLAAMYLRYGRILGISRHFDDTELLLQFIIILVVINLCHDFNKDFYRRRMSIELIRVFSEQITLALAIVAWFYFLHISGNLSRLVFIYYIPSGTVITYALRLMLKSVMTGLGRRAGVAENMLVMVSSDRVPEVLRGIIPYEDWHLHVGGIVLTDGELSSGEGERVYEGPGGRTVRVVSDRAHLIDYASHNQVDEVFILGDASGDNGHDEELIDALEEMGVRVDVHIGLLDTGASGEREIGHVGRYPVVSISRTHMSARAAFAKRALDIAGSLAGLVILLIVSVVIVPMIRLDSPGPALFKQQRVGRNGRIFTIYKFRSMYMGAEDMKEALAASNKLTGPVFKMDDDPRVTKVGRMLRRTSLDELPQFINVMKGDMSLVGTRPPTVDEYERYEAGYKARLSMKPGITGLWQVSGRNEIKDFDEVLALDLSYIDNWSMMKDIEILIRTVNVVIKRQGAL